MPIIRFRNPNGDALDFIDVEDRPEARRPWEENGWVGEALPEEPLEAEDFRNMWRNVAAEIVGGPRQPAPPPEPVAEWPPFDIWEEMELGDLFVWHGMEFRVVEDADGNLDIGRIVDPVPEWPRRGARLHDFRGARLPEVPLPTPGKTGEELFRLILAGIKEVYDVDAVIAGGAVRDLVVGDPEGSKDIDVFIPLKWDQFQFSMAELGWASLPKANKVRPYKTTSAKASSARATAIVQGKTVDLVFMDGGLTRENVDQFPVNAQKCVWTLKDGLVVSPEARKDIDGKKFTISSKITDKEQVKVIRDKVAAWLRRPIYKGWKIVEPDIKAWWQKQNDQHTVERGKKEKQKTVWTDIETKYHVPWFRLER